MELDRFLLVRLDKLCDIDVVKSIVKFHSEYHAGYIKYAGELWAQVTKINHSQLSVKTFDRYNITATTLEGIDIDRKYNPVGARDVTKGYVVTKLTYKK
jgi:hypothetical protein